MRNISVEIMNLDKWFKCCLKTFLSRALLAPLFRSVTLICAILVKGVIRNNPVKLF